MSIDNSFNHYFVSKQLSEVRTKSGLTQAQLAETLGISEQAVKNYEKAASQKASSESTDRTKAIAGMKIETLFNIARNLNVSADYLLGLSPVLSPDPTMREVVTYTGLSEDSIDLIRSLHLSEDTANHAQVLNMLFEEPCFIYAFSHLLFEYCSANRDYVLFRNEFANKAEQLIDDGKDDEYMETDDYKKECDRLQFLEDHKDIRHLRMQSLLNQIISSVEKRFIDAH